MIFIRALMFTLITVSLAAAESFESNIESGPGICAIALYASDYCLPNWGLFEDLKCTENDANIYCQAMENFACINSLEYNGKAISLDGLSPEQIKEAVTKSVNGCPKNSEIHIFYAGHGLKTRDQKFAIVPTNEHVLLPLVDILESPVKTITIDSCYAGAIKEDYLKNGELPAEKIICACSESQASYESNQEQMGYFTYCLTSVMSQHPGDGLSPDVINEAITMCRNLISSISSEKQDPFMLP